MTAPTLRGLIEHKNKILIFTGAGISTNSGIPDYRGPDGIWKTRQPVYYQDFMTSGSSRKTYWSQKSHDWSDFKNAEPNSVHFAVASLEKAGKLLSCVTQNIDGLHSKAGLSDAKLVEIHGTNREVECQSCHKRSNPEGHFASFRASGEPPQCDCGGWLKPATISFGQSLRQEDLGRAAVAASMTDLVIALGSSLSVAPAAHIPLVATEHGAAYVIVNRGHTDHDGLDVVTLRLEGDVGEIFPDAVDGAIS